MTNRQTEQIQTTNKHQPKCKSDSFVPAKYPLTFDDTPPLFNPHDNRTLCSSIAYAITTLDT